MNNCETDIRATDEGVVWKNGALKFCCPFRAHRHSYHTQGFYEPTFVKSVNLGVISGGLTREETKRTRS
jgi:hypothetical protein